MTHKLKYRLAIDLGTTSLGWAMIRLNANQEPIAVIKAGVRIFPDGRNPKDQSSLAASRRLARGARRRRDRFLRRRQRFIDALVRFGLFPQDILERRKLETLNPYELRAKGLDGPLSPFEFGRTLFHLNQRRGFKSNRKTDKQDKERGALKGAIETSRIRLKEENCRTIGEWLYKRMQQGATVRARLRETRTVPESGKAKINQAYDLYVDRAMIAEEFDVLWAKQATFNPSLCTPAARDTLKDTLLFQRKLRPVRPGRCTLLPDEERAPIALPSAQRFRIYQEVNNLRLVGENLLETSLNLSQRDILVAALETKAKVTFVQAKKLLGLDGSARFNLEDDKRQELKGNLTNVILAKAAFFGAGWHNLSPTAQDEVVLQLLTEESVATLVGWLVQNTGVTKETATRLADLPLNDGTTNLSRKALELILPELKLGVVTYDKAVVAAGFAHHSVIGTFERKEVAPALPYYGEVLQRHVGFGTGLLTDIPEKRFGRIANPTVHIGLNQVRTVVNALIEQYGHPAEVIVEVARDLKQSRDERENQTAVQAANQRRNDRIRRIVADAQNIDPSMVSRDDLEKVILWEELSTDAADRRCPYTGVQIGLQMLLSDAVEVDHILPFSQTLDDSLNNKVVALRRANRVKGNRTPWEAFGKQVIHEYDYATIVQRAERMPRNKGYRFAEDAMQRWLKEDKDFLARALNDTRYLSRVAREYLLVICRDTRVIPGRMTAMLRAKFGLNRILGLSGEKNRNDHRHHAVDACVIAVTDQHTLQRFAVASADAREKQLDRLVERMPLPWPSYRAHVERAVNQIWVSHKPDHGHEGAMHDDTAYGVPSDGNVVYHKIVDGRRTRLGKKLSVIGITNEDRADRHGKMPDGSPKAYKGYKGNSNYCIEIVHSESGKWQGEVVSTFQAYQFERLGQKSRLRHPTLSLSDKQLVMRLLIGDCVRLQLNGSLHSMRVATISANGQVFLCSLNEANVDARNRDQNDPFKYVSKMAGSLQSASARSITVSPVGQLRDPGFVA